MNATDKVIVPWGRILGDTRHVLEVGEKKNIEERGCHGKGRCSVTWKRKKQKGKGCEKKGSIGPKGGTFWKYWCFAERREKLSKGRTMGKKGKTARRQLAHQKFPQGKRPE